MSIGRHRAPAPPLDLTLAEIDETALALTAQGRLDAATVDDLHEALQHLLTQPGLARLVLDFGPLTSIDSAGAAALTTAHQYAQRRGITLTVVNCNSAVQHSLEDTGVYGRLAQARVGGPTVAAAQSRLPEPRRIDAHAHGRRYPAPGLAPAAAGPHA